MNSSTLYRFLVGFSLIFVIFSACTTEPKSPNIIYILADDLGYGHLSCYGQEKIETPNIDALAAKGMLFTQHYAGAPVCSPSRCVLLTGKHTGHALIRGNDEMTDRGDVWNYEQVIENPFLEGQYPLKAGTVTIANLLKNAGYKTAIIGKWGLGGPETESTPNKMGFDFFYGFNCQRQAWNYFPPYLWKNTEKVKLNNVLMVPGTDAHPCTLAEGADPYLEESYKSFSSNEYAPEMMQKEALNFIRENANNPFFLYYASTIPHTALQAPKRLIDYYHQKFGDEEPYLGDKGYFPARYPHATFAAMINYLDEQVGELVSELKKLGLYENTLIIFSSDNGPANRGGADPTWFDSAHPFKSGPGWGKGNLYEGGIRVPMIAHWPGKIEAGSTTNYISSFYDVMPTICELAGIDCPGDIDGKSFLQVILGGTITENSPSKFLYWEYPGSGGQQAVRLGNWKGMRRKILKDSLRVGLYNLDEDILELKDVSAEHPEVVKQIEIIFRHEHELAENESFRMTQLDSEK